MHSFVIRIWTEEEATETEDVIWRGHITHIPSNERRYFEKLDTVTEFISYYTKPPGPPGSGGTRGHCPAL